MVSKKTVHIFLPIKVIIFSLAVTNFSSFIFADEKAEDSQKNEKVFCQNLTTRINAYFENQYPKVHDNGSFPYISINPVFLAESKKAGEPGKCGWMTDSTRNDLEKSDKKFSELEKAFIKCQVYNPELLNKIIDQQSNIKKCFILATQAKEIDDYIESQGKE